MSVSTLTASSALEKVVEEPITLLSCFSCCMCLLQRFPQMCFNLMLQDFYCYRILLLYLTCYSSWLCQQRTCEPLGSSPWTVYTWVTVCVWLGLLLVSTKACHQAEKSRLKMVHCEPGITVTYRNECGTSPTTRKTSNYSFIKLHFGGMTTGIIWNSNRA